MTRLFNSKSITDRHIVTPKVVVNQTHRPKKHIDNIVSKIKASNKDFVEQTPQNTQSDSETDYANKITIRKADTQPPKSLDNKTTRQKTTAPPPNTHKHPSNWMKYSNKVEHDSTSDIENEPETEERVATTDQQQTQPCIQASKSKATKLSEKKPYIVAQNGGHRGTGQTDIRLRSNIYQRGEVWWRFRRVMKPSYETYYYKLF